MSDARAWLEERQALASAATGDMCFQHWGGQNQNGDYAESILMDGRTGESLAYGLPDPDGDFIVDARTSAPRMAGALTAVLDLHRPEQYDDSYGGATGYMCEECLRDDGVTFMEYPCPTVRAVQAALGGEE